MREEAREELDRLIRAQGDAGAAEPHEPSEQEQRDLEALGTDTCIDCNIQKRIRCLLCMGCYDSRAQRLGGKDCTVRAYNVAGEEVRPAGVTMNSCKEVNLYLGMAHWQVWRGDAWCPWEEQPRSAMPLALCGGMSVTLGPYGALGLFGDVALLTQREACAGETVERDCADVSKIPTPPTPPPFFGS